MRVALLTVSDSAAAGERSDLSGPVLHKAVAEAGWSVVRTDIVPKNRMMISKWLVKTIDEHKVDLVLTSGGAGLEPRAVTPDATRDVIAREAPGIPEAIRVAGSFITPLSMLTRATAGIRGEALIVNLSGDPKTVTKEWATIAPVIEHALVAVRTKPQPPKPEKPREKRASNLPPSPAIDPKASPKGTIIGQVKKDVPEKK